MILLPSRAARPLPTPIALAVLSALLAPSAWAQSGALGGETNEPIELRPAPALKPPPNGEASRKLPVFLKAQKLSGRPDLDTVAEGDVEFRRGNTMIRADRLSYDQPDDLAVAHGSVRISRDGNIYTGPELQVHVQRFEGFFLEPTYHFKRTGAGGTAKRIDFIDDQRAVATGATYSSCPADGSGGPAWILTTDRISLDFATNTGVAEGGVLRFYGVPILGAPRLSFPLTDERKSGWLPPSFGLDSKSGLQTSIPYYWNIAPNRDATLTPEISTRRGPSLASEFRYLESTYSGEAKVDLLPYDRSTGTTRYALSGRHDSDFGSDTLLKMNWLRVSDQDYWKDFPTDVTSLTPRLLASDLQLSRPFGDWTTYARLQQWQVLQTTDPTTRIEAPYERTPQIGARYASRFGPGLEIGFEGEFNHFTSPDDASLLPRAGGSRLHALGSLSRPFVTPGWSLTPKISFNAASYELDDTPGTPGAVRRDPSRVIPTLSLDSAWVFERDTSFFGRSVRQTLEPRLFYVNTPFKDQSELPNFDASAKDFNFDSIFTENAFNGVDRVSDAHQITAGVTTRLLDPDSGAELVRLGAAQRYLLRDQFVTPDNVPLTQHLSDLLLLASTTLVPAWQLEGSVQYSSDTSRIARSVVSARYSPGPFRTISATYRLTRGLSETYELGWQWPLYGPVPVDGQAPGGASGHCGSGTWYGVGHLNYSRLERRLTDGIAGIEYDAGCWIGRVVASRQSTGLSEATSRLLLQLELVGLSKLGTNPLQTLKDNIPGYRLLREPHPEQPTTSDTYD
ncbi:MAG TPA: LPS assembly protein LptD [Burkholderiaceae bacterium]